MKVIFTLIALCLLLPSSLFAQEQCGDAKILGKHTVTAKLKDYFIEEVMEVPSQVIFLVNGQELRLVAEPEDIEKSLTGKKGKQFHVTYENVYGWIGDGCDEYERLTNVKLIK